MLGTDYLFEFERYLDDQIGKSDQINELNEVFREIYQLDEYQLWLNSPSEYPTRFLLPRSFGTQVNDSTKRLLDRYCLLNGSWLEVKIDKHKGRIHLTDGAWVSPTKRVYPFADESTLICDYIVQQGYDREASLLVDPACGCGHHSLALKSIQTKVDLDINPRALAYCRINTLLTHAEQNLCAFNDLRKGLPRALLQMAAPSVLFAVNMPFGIFPKGESLPISLAQDGGDRGATLTFAAMEMIKRYSETAQGVKKIRAVILFYSLGSKSNGSWSWEVVERAKSLFPNDSVSAILLDTQTMWRVNGVKTQACPMPLDQLESKAECRQTFSKDEMESAKREYRILLNRFEQNGYSHLGYGLLDISISRVP